MENVTFLGVETEPVTSTLIEQLDLPDKAGLVVRHVVPDSAASTVLKRHDILLKLDDQILIDQHQLSVLIRNHKEGDEITLIYLRSGKQATAKVKLTKHQAPKMSAIVPHGSEDGLDLVDRNQGYAFDFNGVDRENLDRVLSLIDSERGPGDVVFRKQSGPRPPGPGLFSTSVDRNNSNLVYSDEAGSIELTYKDGHKSIVAKDAKGQPQFSGPVDTPEQRKAMPVDVRGRLEKIESMQDMSFRTDNDFEGGKTMIYHPAGKAILLERDRPPMESLMFM
jgi:hypothetical protein